MTKKKFLDLLEEKLMKQISENEVRRIIYYYDQYIEEGKDYQSEESIIEELGDLDTLVSGLISALDENKIDYTTNEIEVDAQGFKIDINILNFITEVYHGNYQHIKVEIPHTVKQFFMIEQDEHHFQLTQTRETAVMLTSIIPNRYNTVTGGIITIYIPDTLYAIETITNKKGLIKVVGNNQKIQKGKYCTEYGLIHVKGIQGSLDLQTRNGKIKISDCSGETLYAKTTCNEISYSNTNFTEGKLSTTNSSIHGKKSKFDHLVLVTSNGPVKTDRVIVNTAHITTSNAPIKILDLDHPYLVYAATTNGKIDLAPEHTLVDQQYDHYYLSLETTNGPIIVE